MIKEIEGFVILIVGNLIYAYLFSLMTVPFFCAHFVAKYHVSNAKIREFPASLGKLYPIGLVWPIPKFLRYMRAKGPTFARNQLLLRLLLPMLFLGGCLFNILRGLIEARPEAFFIGLISSVIQGAGLYLAYRMPRIHLR